MKTLFLILALVGVSLFEASAQKKIPETVTLVQNAQRRTEIILPKVNGLNVYKADLHTHSIYSDAELTPEQRVKEAWFDGLDIFAMTDHVEYRRHEPKMLQFLKGYTGGKAKKAVNSNVIRKAATEQGILADLNLPVHLYCCTHQGVYSCCPKQNHNFQTHTIHSRVRICKEVRLPRDFRTLRLLYQLSRCLFFP